MKLICRDPVDEDFGSTAVIRRSCGPVKAINSGIDTFVRFDNYMKACGYASSMERSIAGIDSILERRLLEKKNEK